MTSSQARLAARARRPRPRPQVVGGERAPDGVANGTAYRRNVAGDEGECDADAEGSKPPHEQAAAVASPGAKRDHRPPLELGGGRGPGQDDGEERDDPENDRVAEGDDVPEVHAGLEVRPVTGVSGRGGKEEERVHRRDQHDHESQENPGHPAAA
jgi:hypothetical protein